MLTPIHNSTFAPHTQPWERKKEKLLICLDYFFVPFLCLLLTQQRQHKQQLVWLLCDMNDFFCRLLGHFNICRLHFWLVFPTTTPSVHISFKHKCPLRLKEHQQQQSVAQLNVQQSSLGAIYVQKWSSRVTTVKNTSFRLVDTTKEFQRHEMSIYLFSSSFFTSSNRRRRRCKRRKVFSWKLIAFFSSSFFIPYSRHGSNNVGIFQRHNHSVLHHSHSLVRRSIRCNLLSYDAHKAPLAEVSLFCCITQILFVRLLWHAHHEQICISESTEIISVWDAIVVNELPFASFFSAAIVKLATPSCGSRCARAHQPARILSLNWIFIVNRRLSTANKFTVARINSPSLSLTHNFNYFHHLADGFLAFLGLVS